MDRIWSIEAHHHRFYFVREKDGGEIEADILSPLLYYLLAFSSAFHNPKTTREKEIFSSDKEKLNNKYSFGLHYQPTEQRRKSVFQPSRPCHGARLK